MLDFELDIDIKDIQKRLGEMEKKAPTIQRRVIGRLLSLVKKDIKNKKTNGQVLHKQSGTLFKKLLYKTFKNGYAFIKAGAFYASFHENGADIEPINGEYLTFKIGDEWKRVRHVVLPKREFFTPVVNDWLKTNKGELEADKILQKALDDIFEKASK